MDNSTIGTLSSALDFGSARLEAISNNLSNVNTPGYKRKDASFQAMLDAADGGDSAQLALTTDDPRQISLSNAGQRPQPEIVTASTGTMQPDGNNVDIDAESARLAEAQIYYAGATKMIGIQFTNLKYVIGGGK